MTYQLPNWFIPKYRDEVKVRAQQMKRRLEGLAEDGGMFIGDDCYFPRFGQAETFKSARLAQLALANANMDFVKAAAEPEFIAFGLWDPDKKKLNISAASQFAKASVRAVNRARDRQHIDALADAAANGVVNTKGDPAEQIKTIGDYNTVADLETIAEAIVELGTNEMFEGETVSIIAPFKLRVQNALDPYLAKNDVKGNRPWDDVQWRSYERLPGNGTDGAGWLAGGATGVDMFVHATSAVWTGQNDDDTEINERLGGNLGDMIGRWFQSAAKVDRKSTRLNSSHRYISRMPSSA
jgi:hypothetical protein